MGAQDERERFRLKTSYYSSFSNTKRILAETKPTSFQRCVAERLGIRLLDDDTVPIAAARIEDAVADAVGDTRLLVPLDKQREIARELGLDISGDSRRVAWARIKQENQRKRYTENMEALSRLSLKPGDSAVRRLTFIGLNGGERELMSNVVVSSISWDGVVFLKGGGGRRVDARFLEKQ